MTQPDKVTDHYTQEGLKPRLMAALGDAGLGLGRLSIKQVAPLDQFHARGLAATVQMAAALELTPETRVLDIGSGLGGPSRYLADAYGVQVSGVDLNPAYVEAAWYLAERTGLTERVDYRRANALDLPFAAESFDVAWTQHVAMNIADRARLYAEAWRVLRPGGRLAIYDVVEGPAGDLRYPVPWSRTPETSFLLTAPAMRQALEHQGFEVRSWIDRTQEAINWFTETLARQDQAATDPLGLHLVMGEDFRTMSQTFARNLAENRAGLVETILVKP